MQPQPAMISQTRPDEDGVTFMGPLIPGQPTQVMIFLTSVTGSQGLLDAWIDFGGDGTWLTGGDQIASSFVLVPGPNVLTVNTPATAVPGTVAFARFRLSTKGGLQPTGPAQDGEVEDYAPVIEQEQVEEREFGDAPEGAIAYPSTGTIGQFPTCIGVGPAGFIRHNNFGGWFGPGFDFETDGNAGLCPGFAPYDADECFNDGDAGLYFPQSYTIQGGTVVPCPNSTAPASLGSVCQTATWGVNADIRVHNFMPNHEPYVQAYVNVLMDWNHDGKWAGSSRCATGSAPEHVLVNFIIPVKYDGPLSALGPPNFLIGPNAGYVWTRFSITETPVGSDWDGSGDFEDGETEDYLLHVNQADKDWGDAPDQPYPTLSINNGANHTIIPGFCLGQLVDAETDGQPDPTATGDDINGQPDEDGVALLTPLVPGQPSQIQIYLTAPAGSQGLLDAWIDFGGDGSWLTAGDQIAAAYVLVPGANTLVVNTPATAVPGTAAFARFRLSTYGGLQPTGSAQDGEVEDYMFHIEEPAGVDWGDAPDPTYRTLSASNGANHVIVRGLGLGNIIDAESDGQPDPNALGDDNNPVMGPDDEDGVVWNTPLMIGQNAQITVNCQVPPGTTAYLNAWLDFGIDGTWAQPIDQIISNAIVSSGANTFAFMIPPASIPGTTFARFRLSTQPGLSCFGSAQDGEVEDYECFIRQEQEPDQDFGDAPDGAAAPGYPTLLTNAGARHTIVPGFCLGAYIDAEFDGQPTTNADGDDNNPPMGPDDEDGVTFNSPLLPGATVSMTVTASVPTGMNAYLDGWIDFNNDWTWATPGDRIFTAQPISAGANYLSFTVPASAPVGITTYARFRLSSNPSGLPYYGACPDGEVEDYVVKIGYKWIQKPDLERTGIDVCASEPYILADDFECSVTGPITDIHLWGSWLHDILPGEGEVRDPLHVTFTLSIHEDIPATPDAPSHPGKVLWVRTFQPPSFVAFPYASNLQEGWMYPPDDYDPLGDTTCWEYDFYIDENPFIQQGKRDDPESLLARRSGDSPESRRQVRMEDHAGSLER